MGRFEAARRGQPCYCQQLILVAGGCACMLLRRCRHTALPPADMLRRFRLRLHPRGSQTHDRARAGIADPAGGIDGEQGASSGFRMDIKYKVKEALVASWRCETTRKCQELPYDNNTTGVSGDATGVDHSGRKR